MSANPRAARAGAFGFAAIALGCAGFAAYLVSHLLTAKGYGDEPTRPIVVAKRSLSPAEPLTRDAVEVVSWPASSVPEGAVSEIDALFVGGRVPLPSAAILKGEPIVPARLAMASQGTGIAALLRPGYRAVAVKVEDAVGRAGLVYPGAHVDVLATIRDPEGRGPSTRIAVQNARVLAVESETDVALRKPRQSGGEKPGERPGGIDGTVVTLEVAPADAEIVSLAVREGRIDLALRNGSDEAPADTDGATPLGFSAFAPARPGVAAGDARDGSDGDAVATLETPAAAALPQKRAGRRRIEIRASDAPDTAPASTAPASSGGGGGGIETYRAR